MKKLKSENVLGIFKAIKMSISTNSTNFDFTPTEREVNCESISLDNDGQQSDGKATDQQQSKEFREKCSKMEMDFKIFKLELEKKLLEEKLKNKELMLEHSLIQSKLAKMEEREKEKPSIVKEMKELLAREMEKQQTMLFSKFDGLVEQQRVNGPELESAIKTKVNNELEEQQNKMDNFIDTLKERTNELLKAVHQNVLQPIVEKFSNPQQNCWDVNACHNDLEIVGPNKTIVHYQRNGRNDNLCWRNVFAKYSILPRNNSIDIFYFEISVLNLKSTLFFGFAFKNQAKLDDELIHLNTGTYARVSSGTFWINGTKRGDAKYAYGCGDIVGFGVILITRQLIFTKNGLLLDTADLFVDSCFSADSLFPFISLCSFDDKIEAGFGLPLTE